MAKRNLIISENDIIKLFLDEMNDNVIGVKFENSNFYTREDGGLVLNRMAFNTKDGRFDIRETFDEQTYFTNEEEFTAMEVSNLNTQILAHNEILEINYNPVLSFLINIEDSVKFLGNKIAIEEVRTRLIQETRVLKFGNYDINNLNDRKQVETHAKVIFSSSEIEWGSTIEINGRFYITCSFSVNLFLTSSGELSNQQEFYFYTDKILNETTLEPIEFKIPLITWYYGKGTETEDYQVIATRRTISQKIASEVKSIPTSKGFAMNFTVEMDFNNKFLEQVYLESINEVIGTPKYYIKMVSKRYNKSTGEYEVFNENKRAYILTTNAPNEELSLGEKIYYSLVFTPSIDRWFE